MPSELIKRELMVATNCATTKIIGFRKILK